MNFYDLSDEGILDLVKPLAEHTENSWNQKNYDEFCRFFLEENPEQKFPEDEFNRQIEESYDTYGAHTIADLVNMHRNPDYVIVIWKVGLENRRELGLLIYGFREHEGSMYIEGCSYHA